MRMLKRYIFGLIVISILFASCNDKQDLITPNSSTQIEVREPEDPPLVPGEPILGDELQNPYDIVNMQNAYALLTGSSIQFIPTHYYLKLLPADGEDITEIEVFEELYGYEFETQPIHFQVLADGMEDYVDLTIGDQGFSPEYGAVTKDDFTSSQMPNVPYVVLNEMYMPEFETRLTFTAFVISGNEKYYEAIDGLCHPDCPTWPDCLNDASLTCQVGPNIGYIPTIDPFTTQPKENFPGYLLDEDLGYHGEIDESTLRIPDIPDEIDCPPGCIPLLDVSPIGLNGWFWYCDCSGEGGGGLGDPPHGQVVRCGCNVYDDKRMPGGKISVSDTQLPDEGVRRVKVMTAPRHFGFIWKSTNTDDNGCWKIDKRYNVKRLKIKPVFKDRVSDRMIIRSLRGVRFWNAFLKPVKHKFLVKRTNKDWHSLCLLLEDSSDDHSRNEQSYVAALTNNSIHEYYDDYSNMPSPGKIKVLIHTIGDDLNSSPMLSEMDQDQFTLDDISNFLSAHQTLFTGLLYDLWNWSKPDVFLSFGDDRKSDRKKETVYHEMTHVSQYAVAGPSWWEQYVFYIIGIGFTNFVGLTNQPGPYGDGSSPNAGRAELAEGMAYSSGYVIADSKYGLSHSLGGVPQTNRYINTAESFTFFEPSTSFIPSGLFFDLFDENGVFPSAVSVSEPGTVTDNVKNFPFETQVQMFGLPLISDIELFKNALWQFHGAPSGTQLVDYDELFSSYGH